MSTMHYSPNIIAIIQARMSSSRLPGKALADLAGEPMLVRVVNRTSRARSVSQVVVATTDQVSDDPIAMLCTARGYPCFRGNLYDVLDRYYQAAKAHSAQVIVRITADCPVIDPVLIDTSISAFLGTSPFTPSGEFVPPWDFAANRLPPPWKRTYPIGLDIEVCSFIALERAWREADQPHQREHVMPYLYQNSPVFDSLHLPVGEIQVSPGQFRILLINHEPDYGALRWTVDTPADLELLREIYARFPGRDDFSWLEILDLFQREPQLAAINAEVQHKTAFDFDAPR
jgi:spore coat polysaccharide biosynthesis protein SpsF